MQNGGLNVGENKRQWNPLRQTTKYLGLSLYIYLNDYFFLTKMCLKQVENARNMCIGAILLINFVPKAKFIFILEPEFLS